MPNKNVPLLMATMAMIKVYPEKHDQGTWIDPCNTTMCYAGHAASIAGATFDPLIFLAEDVWMLDPQGVHVPEAEAYDGNFYENDRTEGYNFVDEFARDKLGLSRYEADYLFHHSRSRKELENAVQKFCDGYTVDYDGEFYKKES